MNFIKDPRGFRNNNPGNIRHGADWRGEKKGDDKSFETFTSVEWGIRAIYKLIDAYIKLYGIETIQGVIARYAPSSENETIEYIESVCDYMYEHAYPPQSAQLYKLRGLAPVNMPEMKTLLVAAIIHHENGLQPFSLDFLKGCSAL